MPPLVHNNAWVALGAAAFWGGGDFAGGMGVKSAGGATEGALRVIIAAHAISLAVLLCLLWSKHAPMPQGAPLYWGLAAGVLAALSVTAFYVALSHGAMGASAAISGLLAAAIPAVVSSIMEGAPSGLRIAGFAAAAASIWLIASGEGGASRANSEQQGTTYLAVGAGVGFGFYFVALRMANPLGVLEPMALARSASLTSCLLLLAILRQRANNSSVAEAAPASGPTTSLLHLNATAWLWVVGVAVLDTFGNMFFVASTRMGRLDIASVLSSLYPAATILLAAWVLHERPSLRQLTGMAIALAAILMITL